MFRFASEHRALVAGAAFAAAAVGFALHEACKQNTRRGENVYKTWRTTSSNPRPEHAAMNGETVQYDQPFSNGLKWPGDISGGGPEQVANCHCVIDAESRGAQRAERYGEDWQEADMEEVIQRLVPGAVALPVNERGKVRHISELSVFQVVEDVDGDYFRIIDSKAKRGDFGCTDLDGNLYDYEWAKANVHEYQRLTHFRKKQGGGSNGG